MNRTRMLQILDGHVLFSETIYKQSDYLKKWNPRYLKIIQWSRQVQNSEGVQPLNMDMTTLSFDFMNPSIEKHLYFVYWLNCVEATRYPKYPRGIFSADHIIMNCDDSALEILIYHFKDELRISDCFGSRKNIQVNIRLKTLVDFNNFKSSLSNRLVHRKHHHSSEFSLNEKGIYPFSNRLENIQSRYIFLEKIGKGAFSTVYRAKPISGTETEVAIKIVQLNRFKIHELNSQKRSLCHEIDIMRKIKK